MKVAILAEGSSVIGAGHQVRMGVLARALVKRGHAVELWTRDLEGSTHTWAWRGYPCQVLKAGASLTDLVASAVRTCDRLIVDHYGVEKSEHAVVIDDVPGRDLTGAALVVNQNLGVEASEYPVRALVGPQYALVREPFAGVARHPMSEFLVMIGATDDRGLNAGIAKRLRDRFADHIVNVVTAADFTAVSGIVVHQRLDGDAMAKLMGRCRAAVISAGSSVYEAMAVGLPFVAVHTESNQDRVAQGLKRGCLAPVIPADAWGKSADLVESLPASTPRLVDGMGADRIVAEIEKI